MIILHVCFAYIMMETCFEEKVLNHKQWSIKEKEESRNPQAMWGNAPNNLKISYLIPPSQGITTSNTTAVERKQYNPFWDTEDTNCS